MTSRSSATTDEPAAADVASETSVDPRASAPDRPSAARERILRTADRLFYDEGIHAVGIQRVVAEAGVTRVTLYRHFPSKDDLVAAYLDRRAEHDHAQVDAIVEAYRDDPRGALTELAAVLTRDDFAGTSRGCPFINASAEFTGSHAARVKAGEIREWVTGRLEELLRQVDHRDPRAAAQQLMMLRTGAVVSGALDANGRLGEDFLASWDLLVDAGLPPARQDDDVPDSGS
ncbi:TetR/AcrR family transcriptional regulator [Luteimicrobium subarcticum]|uniref:TetR family transcriptional regulator n=1 Tax=Luteimicrobium subarcticum TaxID=620910 RepID=A0A2M8WUR9_9MICO|nr:TetR/AcrR family transcriptional regulator [Luteimicrobium subarcticum]PJI94649.1 TetR family transcriptional regulator [Luteimicrobium subarcticum]